MEGVDDVRLSDIKAIIDRALGFLRTNRADAADAILETLSVSIEAVDDAQQDAFQRPETRAARKQRDYRERQKTGNGTGNALPKPLPQIGNETGNALPKTGNEFPPSDSPPGVVVSDLREIAAFRKENSGKTLTPLSPPAGNGTGNALPKPLPDVVTNLSFGLRQLEELFSTLRKNIGGGSFRAQRSDYDRGIKAVEWAREELPHDPARVCGDSISNFLAFATGKEGDGWPFWGWANDPGKWLAYKPRSVSGAGPVSSDFDESENPDFAREA